MGRWGEFYRMLHESNRDLLERLLCVHLFNFAASRQENKSAWKHLSIICNYCEQHKDVSEFNYSLEADS